MVVERILMSKFVPSRLQSFTVAVVCAALCTIAFCFDSSTCRGDGNSDLGSNWKQILQNRLAEFGHRNWIVIADSAYPAQTSPGIETVVTGADQIEVVKQVLADLKVAPHVKPIIYTDAELQKVPDSDAHGIEAYRQSLSKVLAGNSISTIPHDEIISRLNRTSQAFKVLILKTNLTLPYTSVFMQLDCGYWSADAEGRLRAAQGNK
jgi:L-fucose mutarotase/ribose pyranase (RbsD/FucU family)